jgi:hypothetical protein
MTNLNIRRITIWAAVLLAALYIAYNGYVFFTCPGACQHNGYLRCPPPPCP